MAAIGVDTARWYQEAEQVQKAADAAALAGVTYMPNDMTRHAPRPSEVATKNGYRQRRRRPNGDRGCRRQAERAQGHDHQQGQQLLRWLPRLPTDWITRAAVADYTAPAPMGSPCNTFGNEPPGSSTGPTPSRGRDGIARPHRSPTAPRTPPGCPPRSTGQVSRAPRPTSSRATATRPRRATRRATPAGPPGAAPAARRRVQRRRLLLHGPRRAGGGRYADRRAGLRPAFTYRRVVVTAPRSRRRRPSSPT